jgi:hypothetical protein
MLGPASDEALDAVRAVVERHQKLTAIRGVERGVYRVPGPELEAFKRRSTNRVELPYPPVETRDLTSPEAFYRARIAPVLEQADEPSADRLLVRVAAEDALRRRFVNLRS